MKFNESAYLASLQPVFAHAWGWSASSSAAGCLAVAMAGGDAYESIKDGDEEVAEGSTRKSKLGIFLGFLIMVTIGAMGAQLAGTTPEDLAMEDMTDDAADASEEVALPEPEEVASAPETPHIVYVLFDDMGWNDIGYQSTDMAALTPVLSDLAENGVKLTQYYTQSTCTVSRAALLSGVLPMHNGISHGTIVMDSPIGLPLKYKLLPQYLQESGYRTYMVGKWDIGHFNEEYLPHNRGFDHFFGFYGADITYFSHISSRGYCANPNCFPDLRNEDKTMANASMRYTTDLFREQAVGFVEGHAANHATDPLFLYLSFNAPHYPTSAPQEFMQNEAELLAPFTNRERRVFAAVVNCADRSVGRVVEALKATGAYNDSVILFASDNGAVPTTCNQSHCTSESNTGSNWPLRGMKATYWEGGCRVPAFVHAPKYLGDRASGSLYQGIVHITDWIPTIVRGVLRSSSTLLGAEVSGADHWDSIRKLATPPRTELLYGVDHCVAGGQLTGAIRVDNWKFIIDYNYSNYPVPTTQEPFLERYNTTDITDHLVNGSLFDLAADPNERTDLANAHPELAATMRKKLMEHYAGSTECYMCPPAGMKAFDVWNAKESFIGPWEADADSMYSCRT